MRRDLQERAVLIGTYICSTHDTIRGAADLFGVSKSTAHLDVSKRLRKINAKLYRDTQKILEENFADKHIRGGQSTKRKYEKK